MLGRPIKPGDDIGICFHVPAAHRARGLQVIFATSGKSEGAGNAGCALHPRSRVQCNKEVRTRAYRAAENIRHSLRNGFTAYNVLSPVSRSSLATVAPEKLISPELDASISGVRTTRLCRTLSRRSLSALPASTATRPTFANDHEAPL